jgi:hypothetical protein
VAAVQLAGDHVLAALEVGLEVAASDGRVLERLADVLELDIVEQGVGQLQVEVLQLEKSILGNNFQAGIYICTDRHN